MKQPKATICISLLTLLSILLIGCTAPADPAPVVLGGEWKVVLQVKVEQPVRMAAFLDEDFGLTGGASNRAYVTTDGGQAWTMAESGLG